MLSNNDLKSFISMIFFANNIASFNIFILFRDFRDHLFGIHVEAGF